MNIWGQKIYDSEPMKDAKYQVVGHHKELGHGILSYHKEKWSANYNSMLINSDGGKSEVVIIG